MVTHSVLYVFIFTLSMYFFFFINQKKVKKKVSCFGVVGPKSCEPLVRSENRGPFYLLL